LGIAVQSWSERDAPTSSIGSESGVRVKSVTIIEVKAKPRARQSVLEETSPGVWRAQLKSAPVDGKANEELIALVAERFGCPTSAVSIKSGGSSRTKRVRIQH
jgi:uncharacterized protein (TIGR00251 family)